MGEAASPTTRDQVILIRCNPMIRNPKESSWERQPAPQPNHTISMGSHSRFCFQDETTSILLREAPSPATQYQWILLRYDAFNKIPKESSWERQSWERQPAPPHDELNFILSIRSQRVPLGRGILGRSRQPHYQSILLRFYDSIRNQWHPAERGSQPYPTTSMYSKSMLCLHQENKRDPLGRGSQPHHTKSMDSKTMRCFKLEAKGILLGESASPTTQDQRILIRCDVFHLFY